MPIFPVLDTVAGRIRLYSVVMACLPLLFAALVLVVFIRADIIRDSQDALLEQAQSHKIFIEEWFRERQNTVKFLAELDAVRRGDLDQSRHIFQKFDSSHKDISAVVMVGPDGKTVADSLDNILVDVTDREYFIKARAGEPHVTKVIIGRTSGRPIIIFSHPVTRPDGTFNTPENPLSCTISIGIAGYASDIRFGADAWEDMLARADKALYAAKAAGRNTIRISGEEAFALLSRPTSHSRTKTAGPAGFAISKHCIHKVYPPLQTAPLLRPQQGEPRILSGHFSLCALFAQSDIDS